MTQLLIHAGGLLAQAGILPPTIEVASGGRKIHRLSLRGNGRLNHAIHMAAITQIRDTHSPGRAYFDRLRWLAAVAAAGDRPTLGSTGRSVGSSSPGM